MSHHLATEYAIRQTGATLNRYYAAGLVTSPAATTTLVQTVDILRALPMMFPRAGIIDSIACAVTAGGGAGSVGRVGIYASLSSTNLPPATLIVDGGQFDGTTVAVKAAVVNVTLRPDLLYWMVYVCGVAAPTTRAITNAQLFPIFGIDAGFGGANQFGYGWQVAFPYAALPAAFPGGGAVVNATASNTLLGYRFAA